MIARIGIRVRPWLGRPELLIPAALAACVFLVHDVGYVLRTPFWVDEAWVAVTTKFSVGQLPATTSSTPIGWSVTMRLFAWGGPQDLRLLPLLFAAGATVAAYSLARDLGWRDRRIAVSAGILAGIGVLMVPAMLVRDDLKQYTADAFLALLVLALVSRLERGWTPRRLTALGVTVVVGMLFSHTVEFVGAAAFASILSVQALRRARPRVREVLVAGAATAIGMVLIYLAFDARAVVAGLTSYWRDYFLPTGHGLGASWRFVRRGLRNLGHWDGLGPGWAAAVLIVAGVATIVRLGRVMTACTVLVLVPEMLAVSAARKYPLFDLRTSTFLIVVMVVVAAIGAAGVSALAVRRVGVGGLLVPVVAAGSFIAANTDYVRSHTIEDDDVRSQASYVGAHRAPGDIVLVNLSSNWGFGYYFGHGPLSRKRDTNVVQGYIVDFPKQPGIMIAPSRDSAGVLASLAAAQAAAAAGTRRIWLVRTHVLAQERAAWQAALHERGLTAIPIGDSGLSMISVR